MTERGPGELDLHERGNREVGARASSEEIGALVAALHGLVDEADRTRYTLFNSHLDTAARLKNADGVVRERFTPEIRQIQKTYATALAKEEARLTRLWADLGAMARGLHAGAANRLTVSRSVKDELARLVGRLDREYLTPGRVGLTQETLPGTQG